MRRLKTETLIIGSGAAAILMAGHLTNQGQTVILINPEEEFHVDDLRPSATLGGMGLWNAAYRLEKPPSLTKLYDELKERLREVFPASTEYLGLERGEQWSILSNTPIHRPATEELEREFFKLEKKSYSLGHFRLANRENTLTRFLQSGLDLSAVAQVGGAVVRSHALFWNANLAGFHLLQYVRNKFFSAVPDQPLGFVGAKIVGRHGRQIQVRTADKEDLAISYDRNLLIFLTGDLLGSIRTLIAGCDEPWIQGIRKRRREQHFIKFENFAFENTVPLERFGFTLGGSKYNWHPDKKALDVFWSTTKGPDGFERVVDESFRISHQHRNCRHTRSARIFRLEWEWKLPQWRKSDHETLWATGFEGDLWNMTEILWNSHPQS